MHAYRRSNLRTVATAVVTLIALAIPVAAVVASPRSASAATPCDSPPNEIVAENCKTGAPASQWDVTNGGAASIQGFATQISVDAGQTVHFKVDTSASSYTIDVYRLGYYGGDGARHIATVAPSVSLPQQQPDCLDDAATGLVDCGNWTESASWAVPTDAVSGAYIAKLQRNDGNTDASHIVFIVRDDGGNSDLVFQTSDTTWEAYNDYGGNSLYTGSPAGRGYKVSYNRPFVQRDGIPEDSVFNAEYPMIRWLEANGYDVSYISGVDTDRVPAALLTHNVFMSVGHDEYWSGTQRANVEAARDAGVNLAFFSGNEVFWKTRWENSIDGTNTPRRTLVSYKETHANAKIDPSTQWTGTWRDPRFSPPADGGRPENGLTGTIFTVNCCTYAMQVGAADGALRFWRNTSVASSPGSDTLPAGTLGYEWDEDLDNGARPAGLIRMSSTTQSVSQRILDYGSNYGPGTATHSLTLYKKGNALVFGAGTVQWSWGLDGTHDRGGSVPSTAMQQATVNLFADMGVQPANLQAGLTAATATSDATAPPSTITAPSAGASTVAGSPLTVSGTASDTAGAVGGVEVSTDNGTTWHRANGRGAWTYTFTPTATGTLTLRSRATDDSGNIGSASTPVGVTVTSSDTTPPAISNVAATPTATGVVTISWTTDEASTSLVTYGTAPSSLSSSAQDNALTTTHSLNLTGLAPGATYYFRAGSTDASGNQAVSPVTSDPPGQFRVPTFVHTDSTRADFAAGTLGACRTVADVGTGESASDGEVVLGATEAEEFDGSSLPAGWTPNTFDGGGSVAVTGGKLVLNGGRAVPPDSAFLAPVRSLEFEATFTPGPYQHFGFADAFDAAPFAAFSTGADGATLKARTDNGGELATGLGTSWFGTPHRYRIDLTGTEAVYSIDGTEVARHAVSFTQNLRPVGSDVSSAADSPGSLSVDWFDVTPYASPCTFTSQTIDAGATRDWTTLTNTASLPAGTGVAFETRSSADGSAWSAWVATTGSTINSPDNRFLQYRATLTTGDDRVTPSLGSVTIVANPPAESVPPTTSMLVPANNASVRGNVTLDATASDNVGVSSVEFVINGGTLHDVVVPSTLTPYGYIGTWNTTSGVADGVYQVVSRARDAAGNVGTSASINVRVDNTAPAAQMLVPANNTSTKGSVTLDASATDNVAVTKVVFRASASGFADAQIATVTSTPYGWIGTWNSNAVPEKAYQVRAVATDAAGNSTTSASITVTIDRTAPTTAVIVPSNNNTTVSGTTIFDVSASDNVGVTRVEFRVTGPSTNAVIGNATSTQYGWLISWNTSGRADGTYTITSTAFDAAGNSKTSTARTVRVDN